MGRKKINFVRSILFNEFLIADINVKSIIDKYAEIDAFSQNKLPGKPLGSSSRNMGKNDVWIAATAAVLTAKIITTDKDFNHLKNLVDVEFVKVK